MKRWSLAVAVLAILVLALTLPVSAPAAPAPHHPVVAAASRSTAPAAAAQRERHPEIRAAMESLHQAHESLEHADHDFGGHRVAAMKHIEQATHELQLCLKYDRH